jgi:enoyl-[acyl-carrier protein] reductase II
MLAAFALGAEGVQIGTRFAVTAESSLHDKFKNRIVESREGETILTLKQLMPVRLLKNKFYEQVDAAEHRGAGADELKNLLGRARAKKGMFEGDLDEGELEIGQVASLVKEIKPAAVVLKEVWDECLNAKEVLCKTL